MMLKVVKTMEKQDILKLIEACGEMARGLKKIKTILTRSLDGLPGQKNPQKPQPVPEPGAFVPNSEWVVSTDPEEFLLKQTWGKASVRRCLRAAINKTVRSDVFKTAWVRDANQRKGWRKISKGQYKNIFSRCEIFFQEVQDVLYENDTLEKFCQNVGKVCESKWSRRECIVNPEKQPDEKLLREITREIHDELPALRGGKA